MKNLFSVLFSACLITLFSAFTSNLNNTSNIEAESTVEKVLTTQSGKIKACFTAVTPNPAGILTYRLNHQGTAASIQSVATCDLENLTLECGEWDVYLVLNGSNGTGHFDYSFPTTSGSFSPIALTDGVPEYAGQMQIF